MKKLNCIYIAGTFAGFFLVSCAQQPAPIINGYNRNSQLMPIVKVHGPSPLKQEAPVASLVQSSIPAHVNVEAIEPAAGPSGFSKAQTAPTSSLSQSAVREQGKQAVREVELIQHTIAPTDTVYSIASKYESSASAILKQNGLKATSDIRAGEVIVIPAYSHPKASLLDQVKQTLKAQSSAPVSVKLPDEKLAIAEAEMRSIEPAAGASLDIKQNNLEKAPQISLMDHQVQQGETIYRISRMYNSSVLDIMAANEFDTPQQLKYGTMVKVPVHSTVVAAAEMEPAAGPQPASADLKTLPAAEVNSVLSSAHQSESSDFLKVSHDVTDAVPDSVVNNTQQSVVAVKQKATAALETEEAEQRAAQETVKIATVTASDEMKAELKRGQIDPAAANAAGKVWPVKGKILRRFGEEGNGVAYTGINIAVPPNTPVLATDQGSVLYADEGLKTYGKLVLIRHKDGTVSAYAHNGHLLVRKGESVKKGQIIAMSGASGNVDSPQLHFELRQHASALDPMKVLPQL